jgi:hypothetical protein
VDASVWVLVWVAGAAVAADRPSLQKFVRGIEEVQVSVDRTIRGSEEDGSALRVVDGYIGLAAAAARLFDDVRSRPGQSA